MPGGKRGGEHKVEEGESEEKRRSHTDKQAGTLKIKILGFVDLRALKVSYCETRNPCAP